MKLNNSVGRITTVITMDHCPNGMSTVFLKNNCFIVISIVVRCSNTVITTVTVVCVQCLNAVVLEDRPPPQQPMNEVIDLLVINLLLDF